MGEAGTMFVQLLPSARGFGRATERQVGGEVKSSGGRVGKTFGTALKLGAGAAIGGAVLAAGFLKGSISEAREAQKVGAQTNAVIKSTGGVANVTAGQVGKLSTAISSKSGIDDEAIASGANLLLTFTNVRNEAGKGNDVFNQTTQAATDMSVALGTDMKSSAMQLGKALNDPVKGMTKLQRSGVTFTDQQKKQVAAMTKSGDVLGAQKIILGEVNREFGGSAAASATAGDKFKTAFGNLQESVGTALLPLIDKVLGGLTGLAGFLTANIGPAFSAVSGYLAPLVKVAQSFFASFTSGGGGASGALAGMLPMLKTLGSSIGTTIGAVAKYIQALLPTLIAVGQKIGAALGPAITQIGNLISTQLLPAFRAMLPVVLPIAKFLLQMFGTVVVGLIHGFVQAISGAINIISGIFKLIVALVHGDWSGAWSAVVQIVKGAFGLVIGLIKVAFFSGIPGLIRTGIVMILGLLAGLAPKAGSAIMKMAAAVGHGIVAVVKFFIGLPGKALGALASLGSKLAGLAGRAFKAFLGAVGRGIAAAVRLIISLPGKAIRALGSLGKKLASLAWNAFQAFGRAENRGITAAIGFVKSLPGKIGGALKSLGGKLVSIAGSAFKMFSGKIRAGITTVVDYFKGIPGKIRSGLSNIGSALLGVGKKLVDGLINGIKKMAGAVVRALVNLLPYPLRKFAEKLGLKSPSTVFRAFGVNIGEGLSLGIGDSQDHVNAAMAKLSAGVVLKAPQLSGSLTAAGARAGAGGTGVAGRPINVYDKSGDPVRTAQETVRQMAFAGVS